MRCCEAMLYILQMAPEFPVKPRVDSCNSPLLGHQMPPEAVFPPASMGSSRKLTHWHRSAYLTCWSCSWVHWHGSVPNGSLTGKNGYSTVTPVAFCNLQPNQVICKCGLQNLEQILHFGKLTGQNCPSLFTLLAMASSLMLPVEFWESSALALSSNRNLACEASSSCEIRTCGCAKKTCFMEDSSVCMDHIFQTTFCY